VSTATGTVTVSVTQEHIDRGRPGQCAACPIALALAEAMPYATHIEVYGSPDDGTPAFAEVWSGALKCHFRLPAEADAFIAAFDDEHPVAPFTFVVEVEAP
jgi:hypothetical protein